MSSAAESASAEGEPVPGRAVDLLFLTQRIPYPPEKGDKIRSWHILEHLAQRYRVHLGCFCDAPEDWRHVPFLQSLCASLCVRPLDPLRARLRSLPSLARGEPLTLGYFRDRQLRRWVAETLRRHRPAVGFVFCSAMAPYLETETGLFRVLDMVDVDSEKWRQYAATAAFPMRAVYAREQRQLLAVERRAAAAFDATLLVSEAEASLFAGLAPEIAARLFPMSNGVDLAFFDPGRSHPDPFAGSGPALVFTGAMDYRPNIDGVLWFAQEVMPLLRRRTPGLGFWIVGANPAPAVRQLATFPGVRVTGRVADVRPYLAHAAAVVAPLRIGRGIQNKVLEAMAMARPVVATPAAVEGIAALAGEELLVAETPEGFDEAIAAILEGHLPMLGAQARACVLRDHRWDFSVLDRLIDGRPAAAAAQPS